MRRIVGQVLVLLACVAVGTACSAVREVKKLPSKKSGKSSKGSKGGEPTQPTAESKVKATGSNTKAESPDDDGTFCTDLPEGVAECDGETGIRFCENGVLYLDSCAAVADDEGYSSGICYETETTTDCLVCGESEDGGQECCTTDFEVCCDEAGTCYSSAAAAEPRVDPRRRERPADPAGDQGGGR